MGIQPEAFLEQALELFGDDEVNNRTAASRAYYAVFHKCQQHYSTLVREDSQGGMHRRFIDGLTGSPNKTDKSIGYMLDSVYKGRILADYNLDADFSKEDAQTYLGSSKRLMAKLVDGS